MRPEIYPAARRAIVEVWRYTEATWGADQADRYVRGLHAAIVAAAEQRHRWRRVRHEQAVGVFFVRHEHHYIFFRELSDGRLGVIAVLHENMDLPTRLLDELDTD